MASSLLTQDVVLTSIRRYGRQMDVETTLCAYWDCTTKTILKVTAIAVIPQNVVNKVSFFTRYNIKYKPLKATKTIPQSVTEKALSERTKNDCRAETGLLI